jgi:hypothetical protein
MTKCCDCLLLTVHYKFPSFLSLGPLRIPQLVFCRSTLTWVGMNHCCTSQCFFPSTSLYSKVYTVSIREQNVQNVWKTKHETVLCSGSICRTAKNEIGKARATWTRGIVWNRKPEANSMRGKHGKTICHSSGVETCCDILNLEIRFLRFQLRFYVDPIDGFGCCG